jgi:chemotaxis protein histidine kinase CheA
MPYGFAEKLFDTTHIGMRVIIAPGDAEPVAFSHPSLLVPRPPMIDAAPARADALARAADDATEAAAAAKTTVVIAKREAAAAAVAVPKLERLESRADAELARADKALAAAKTDEAKAAAEDARQKVSAKVAALHAQLDTATADQKAKQEAVMAAQAAAKTAEAKRGEAAKAAKDAKLALEPVSIFISRATGKLYVRRDTHERVPDGGERFDASLEVPVAIRDPDRPIGTHVFTAVARTAGGLRWTAVTIDNGGDAKDSAKDALDRISFPQEVLDRVAPTAVPGSSIIVSDEPLNSETNYRTEFVVVLNNQPQGGLAMRKRPEAVAEARHNGWGDGFFGVNPFLRDPNAQYGAARARGGPSYYPPQQRSW